MIKTSFVRHEVLSGISNVAGDIACPFRVLHRWITPVATLFIHACCSPSWKFVLHRLLDGLETFPAYNQHSPQPMRIKILFHDSNASEYIFLIIAPHSVKLLPPSKLIGISRLITWGRIKLEIENTTVDATFSSIKMME
jgi:hypothetical protein